MKIEVWSDFMCPFCYIGETKLQKAITNLGLQDKIQVEYKSFELDPTAKPWDGQSMYELLAGKYGMTVEQARQNSVQIANVGREIGLSFNMDDVKNTNSLKAHRLAKLGKAEGKEQETTCALFKAHFEEGKLLSDDDVLLSIAKELGLDEAKAKEVLTNENLYLNEVREDQSLARAYHVNAVPYFVLNGKYAVNGAQSIEVFEGAIKQAMGEMEEQPLTCETDGTCSDGACSI